jgi:hypothetical protein
MNKHIELVMKWLADPASVSQEELEENANDAAASRAAAYRASAAYDTANAYDATAAGYRAEADYRAAASRAAYHAAYDVVAVNWVDEFFKVTCENKDDYIAEISK